MRLSTIEILHNFFLILGFVPIGQLDISEGLVRGNVGPKTKNECEVLMMVGLPGAGKTFWAEEWKRRHPEKNYNILVMNIQKT
jgi:heterogeneous nuclear ribonucleoprotein U-like protein 1